VLNGTDCKSAILWRYRS